MNIFVKKLKMWEFVTADEDVKTTKMKKTLEDVFEAFFGATSIIVNSKIKSNSGYNICYNIIKSLFNETEISLKYEDLYDAKTRLKETMDLHKDRGVLKYESERIENICYVKILLIQPNRRYVFLGKGSAALKPDAEQKAATYAIQVLRNKLGIYKPVPEIYKSL